jgi:AcrR family transcriptional regulator
MVEPSLEGPRGASRRRSHVHHVRSGRRTQAERTAETTTKLLDATAACLAELGYGRTSTTEICRRAGVSRGAMLHHFPSKAVLVAAACEHVFERRVEEFRAVIAAVPSGGDRIGAAIDTTWQMFKRDSFAAWFELIVAGRTDPDLQPHVALVAARLNASVRETWFELFEPPSDDPETRMLYETAPALLFAVLDGLALSRMSGMPGSDAEADRVLHVLKLAADALRGAPTKEIPS